jgi:aryl-alcohol dehydrogenase-like predicted oxidoreductase
LDLGVNLIDTAPIYGFGHSEQVVGKALRGRRDEAVLVTKCGQVWHTDKGTHAFDSEGKSIYHYLGPESVRYEVEQSLKRLGTDNIDVYLVHVPDKTTPASATMGEMLRLKEEGKIRAIGVSNVTLQQLQEFRKAGPIEVDQELYSMLDRGIEKELLPMCAIYHISLMAYSPLVQGLLTGKIGPDRKFTGDDLRRENPRFQPENLQKAADLLEELRPIAQANGLTLGQLAIAWTIQREGASHVLVGARTADQVEENAAAGGVELDPEDMAAIKRILQTYAADIP